MFAVQVFTALFASVLMGIAGQAKPVITCARQYTVQPGDFCDAISAAQNSSTYQLALVNQGTINTDCTNLFVGEPLCLGNVGQDCQTTYVVLSGDGCDAIAATAGTTSATLLANNPNVAADCTNIYPGEVLCTATTIVPYNTTSA